jgi:hypothetical protein
MIFKGENVYGHVFVIVINTCLFWDIRIEPKLFKGFRKGK